LATSGTDEVAQALWYTGPGQVEIRQESLPEPQTGELRVRALYGAISRGTEGLVLAGRVPASEYEETMSKAKAMLKAVEIAQKGF